MNQTCLNRKAHDLYPWMQVSLKKNVIRNIKTIE